MAKKSLYDNSYCALALDLIGTQGKSVHQFARYLGVSVGAVQSWRERHKPFDDAMKIAHDWSRAYWETRLEKLITDRSANTGLVKLLFASRFGITEGNTPTEDNKPPPSVIVIT